MKKRIAILGATGYIGKSLLYELGKDEENEIVLYGRDLSKIDNFFQTIKNDVKSSVSFQTYDNELSGDYSAVINCAGIGSPSEYKKNPSAIFEVTEKMDEFVLTHLKGNKSCKYINFSSGAVYGKPTSNNIDESTLSVIDINNIKPDSFYSVAKMNSEAKHRSYSDLNIIDLRIFSFFSQFIDVKDTFLLSELVNSLIANTVFKTNNIDIVRDYVTSSDLARLVMYIINLDKKINDSFDVVSLSPVSKFELINHFRDNYGLGFEITDVSVDNAKRVKNEYYSISNKLKELGFSPEYSSLSGIDNELKKIINKAAH